MNTQQMIPFKQVLLFITHTLLIVLFLSGPAAAQKAPDFSNDLMMDNKTYVFFMADRLEFYNTGGRPVILDAQGYIGKDVNKFWFEVEGEVLTAETEGEMELLGLYSRAISPYFDLQTGIRYDVAYHHSDTQTRGFAVIGVQGLAPYLFEIDGSFFISQSGELSASFEAEYDFPITQRFWGQPRIATSAAIQEVETWGVGSGFNDIQLGFRLRYEIKREFAPYVGISWNRKLGETADIFRDTENEISTLGVVAGFRLWF